jgi:hypothetical protein
MHLSRLWLDATRITTLVAGALIQIKLTAGSGRGNDHASRQIFSGELREIAAEISTLLLCVQPQLVAVTAIIRKDIDTK